MKTLSVRGLLATMLLAVLVAVSACGGDAPGTSSDGPVTVRVGYLKVIQWTHLADIAAHVDPTKVKIELKEFKTSNEVLVALTAGSVDIGDIGYNHLASALERGQNNLEFIAGLSSKGSALVQRKGAGIQSWNDLRGKKIGGSRGSTQYTQLVTGLKAHGMDVNKDVQFINLNSSTDMNIALRNGDVDAVMQWEPGASTAIVEGFGEAVPGVARSLYDETFTVSSGVAARKEFVKDNPAAVQAVVDGYYKSHQKITTDHAYWIDTFAKLVQTPKAVLEQASQNAQPEFGMDQADISRMMKALADSGTTKKDMYADLKSELNYRFITKASGKSAQQLGAS
jgi:ABC-type nitrate/sulfonate/bicarbonate transport system substrate-binding protein